MFRNFNEFFESPWMIALIVLVAIASLVGFGGVIVRNNVAWLEVKIDQSDSDLSILQERKIVLLDELIGATKASVSAEKDLLTQVIALRNSADTTNATASIKILAEAYPDLKSISNFSQVMTEMAITENGLSTQKVVRNGLISDYRTAFITWPSSAYLSGYPQKHYEMYKTTLDVIDWKPVW